MPPCIRLPCSPLSGIGWQTLNSDFNQQPTAFDLSTFTADDIFHTDGLMTELNAYATLQQGPPCAVNPDPRHLKTTLSYITIVLRVYAAADFYSSNSTLMSNPPDVLIDLSKSLGEPH